MWHCLSYHKTKRVLMIMLCAMAVMLVDQLAKLLVLSHFAAEPIVMELAPFLNLVLLYNKGVSFGVLDGIASANLICGVAAMLIVAGLWFWFYKNISFNAIPMVLITGGAFGNLVDRFTRGGVVDFIDFHYYTWHYPAFNVADACIVVGVLLMARYVYEA